MARIEDVRDCHLHRDTHCTETILHVGRLVVADAMFARERAADFDDALHQAVTYALHSRQLVRLP